VLGLARDVLWARYFGDSPASSAFVTAWTVPNVFRALFGEGAVNSAMVPTFTESLKTRTPEETGRLYSVTFTVMLIALGALTLLIELGLAAAGVWGDLSEKTALLLKYTAAMMPYMPLICLAGFFMAALNAQKHFFAPAFMPALLNVVWIGAIIVFARPPLEDAGLWVAFATVFAGLLQVLFQVPFAAARGMRLRLSLDIHNPAFRQILTLLAPVVIGSAAIEVNVLVNWGLAYFAVPYKGAAACLFFGNRMVQLPMAMVGLAISTAVLTPLSEHAALKDMLAFRRTLSSALRFNLFLTVPASAALVALASPIVEVLFRHGKFGPEAATRTVWVILFYCIGLWAQTGVFVILRAFYALKDTRTPPRVAIANVLLNIALSLVFIFVLRLEERGLALATSLCGIVQFSTLFLILRKRIGLLGGRGIAFTAMKSFAVSVVMAAFGAGLWWMWWPESSGIVIRAGALVALCLGCGLIFAAGTAALRMPELKQLLRRGKATATKA
jgi:putative peptidoglycan lipid II flippase